jgi:hypothetical protein
MESRMDNLTWKSAVTVVLVWLVGSLIAGPITQDLGSEPASDVDGALQVVRQMVAVWTDRGAPQPDLTQLIIAEGDDVITGGPLMYGGALAAIYDMTGPDMRDIIRFLEAEEFGFAERLAVARLERAGVPPLPLGGGRFSSDFGGMVMVDLWPAAVWLFDSPARGFYTSQLTNLSTIPEPASLTVLAVGVLLMRQLVCGCARPVRTSAGRTVHWQKA